MDELRDASTDWQFCPPPFLNHPIPYSPPVPNSLVPLVIPGLAEIPFRCRTGSVFLSRTAFITTATLSILLPLFREAERTDLDSPILVGNRPCLVRILYSRLLYRFGSRSLNRGPTDLEAWCAGQERQLTVGSRHFFLPFGQGQRVQSSGWAGRILLLFTPSFAHVVFILTFSISGRPVRKFFLVNCPIKAALDESSFFPPAS